MKTLYPVIIAIMFTVTIILLTHLDVLATCATVNGVQQCAGPPPILTSIKSDKLNYENSDKPVITITGVPYSPAYLEIDDPSGNIVFSHKIDSIQFGVANYTLDISSYKPGVYSASASNSESKVSTTFAVGLLPSGILFVVSTPNTSYVGGEIIPISGHTQRNSSIRIFLLDNYGNVENSTQVMSDDTGSFFANLGIPSHVIGGGWYLFAKNGKNNWMSEIMVNTHGVSTMTLSISSLTPLKQFKLGIDAIDVQCHQGFQKILKREDGSPACVKYTTANILIERGWTNETVSAMVGSETTVIIPQNSSAVFRGLTFTPQTVKVVIGANNTVRWINMDTVTNDITSDTGSFSSGLIESGYAWTHVFDKNGTYGYHSIIHPWLKGTVIVSQISENHNPFGITALVIYHPFLGCLSSGCPPNNFYLKINSNSTAYLMGYNICDDNSCAKNNDLSLLLPINTPLYPNYQSIGLPVNLQWKYGDTVNIQLEVSPNADNKTASLIDLGNSTIVP